MDSLPPIPWEVGNEFLLACGGVHKPYEFCVTVLDRIRDIVPYDQGLFLMLDGNRKVLRSHFVGFSDLWSSMYTNYYSKSTLHGFDLNQEAVEPEGRGFVVLIDWREYDWIRDDFMVNYIRPRRLNQSLAFTFFDLNGSPATAFSLDRLVDRTFTEQEIEVVSLITAHLNNLYKNMFARPQGQVRIWDHVLGSDELTSREKEVLELLCQGVKPSYIARELRITVSTTNKHIAHIYRKLGVDSRQELLVRLLGK